MDQDLADDARAWARRYLEVVERFDLCPWAAPARARGEVWVGACDEDDLMEALAGFERTPTAIVGLCVLPRFTGGLSALRRLRTQVTDSPIGQRLAVAEFHPDAPLDAASPARLVPYLRRSPDPMLQVVRHETLAGFKRGGTTLASVEQLSLLAGKYVAPPRDIAEDIAQHNHATMLRDGAALAAALDELITSRRAVARPRSA